MNQINSDVSGLNKFEIYVMPFKKVMRGFFLRPMFKSVSGLLIFIGKGTSITNKSSITLGKNVKIEDFAEVQGLSTHGIHLGNGVTIGKFSMIRPSSYYGVGNIGYGLEMKKNSSIGPYGYIGCAGKIKIGENVMIGPKVSLFAENHMFSDKLRTIKDQGVVNKGIEIENNCWIGSGVTILDGVTIGTGSVIGAGTLISKNVPRNSIIYDKRNRIEKVR